MVRVEGGGGMRGRLSWLGVLVLLGLGGCVAEDVASQEAFACRWDGQCATGYVCFEEICVRSRPTCEERCDGPCVDDVCVPSCDVDSDCADGLTTCQEGVCRPPVACGGPLDCPESQRCVALGVCLPDPAWCDGLRCAESERCEGGECLDACDNRCAANERCDGGVCFDACDNTCAPDERCDGGECLDACDNRCAADERCDGGVCFDACDNTCAPDERCEGGACLDDCDNACAPGVACVDGRCDAPCDDACLLPAMCVLGECLCGEAACDPGEVCDALGGCTDPCLGVVCGGDAECVFGDCLCGDAGPCGDGATCERGECVDGCMDDGDCADGVCVEGGCRAAECRVTADCGAPDLVCVGGRCEGLLCDDGCCEQGAPVADAACYQELSRACADGCAPAVVKTYLAGRCDAVGACQLQPEERTERTQCDEGCVEADGGAVCGPDPVPPCLLHQRCEVATGRCVANCDEGCCPNGAVEVGAWCGVVEGRGCTGGCAPAITTFQRNGTCTVAGTCDLDDALTPEDAPCGDGLYCTDVGNGRFACRANAACDVECVDDRGCGAEGRCVAGRCVICDEGCCVGDEPTVDAPCAVEDLACDGDCGSRVVGSAQSGRCDDRGACQPFGPLEQVDFDCGPDAYCVEEGGSASCQVDVPECAIECQGAADCAPGQGCADGVCRNLLCEAACCELDLPVVGRRCERAQSRCPAYPCAPVVLEDQEVGTCGLLGGCVTDGALTTDEIACGANQVCVQGAPGAACAVINECVPPMACGLADDTRICRPGGEARCVDDLCAPWACEARICNAVGVTVGGWREAEQDNSYQRAGNVITHVETGLEWHSASRSAIGERSTAHFFCDSLGDGGGWRVPTWFELLTVAPLDDGEPPLPGAEAALDAWHLSRTVPGGTDLLAVRFSPLAVTTLPADTGTTVRCVRSNPPVESDHMARVIGARANGFDSLLGRTWVSPQNRAFTQIHAAQDCAALGDTLPTVLEVATLISWHPGVARRGEQPAAIVGEADDAWVWTADNAANGDAYLVNLQTGDVGTPSVNGASVKCLRGD